MTSIKARHFFFGPEPPATFSGEVVEIDSLQAVSWLF